MAYAHLRPGAPVYPVHHGLREIALSCGAGGYGHGLLVIGRYISVRGVLVLILVAFVVPYASCCLAPRRRTFVVDPTEGANVPEG
jgi:hypothetical protein